MNPLEEQLREQTKDRSRTAPESYLSVLSPARARGTGASAVRGFLWDLASVGVYLCFFK